MNLLFVGIASAMFVSGVLGAVIAGFRGKHAFLWFLICFALPVLGIVIVSLRPASAHAADDVTPMSQPQRLPMHEQLPQKLVMERPSAAAQSLQALPVPSIDERWSMLIEYDPVLRDAAEQLEPFGPECLAKLRQAYFILQDRSLVPSIVARIQEKHEARQADLSRLAPLQLSAPRQLAPPQKAIVSAGPVMQQLQQWREPTGAGSKPVPLHNSVTPQDLSQAHFMETHRGVHLYRLSDGRTYVDGQMALVSADAAREFIDRGAQVPPPHMAPPLPDRSGANVAAAIAS
jgi:hypothetical protein